ncbi:sensor domain-containing diguanylate cyclase [Clostridium sp. DL1XJH146]
MINYINSKEKVDELLKTIKQNRFSNFGETLSQCEEAYSLSNAIDYDYGMAYSKLFQGEIMSFSANYQDGIKLILSSIEIAEKMNNMDILAASYNSLANALFEISNFEKALENYNNTLKIAKENSLTNLIAIAYNNIGEIFRELKCEKIALDYYQKSIAIDSQIDFKGCKGSSYINLAYCNYLDGDYDTAYNCIIKALKLLNKFGYYTVFAESFNLLALISWKTNNLQDADKKFKRALALANKYINCYSKIMITKDYYLFTIENKSYHEGIEILKDALKTYKDNNFTTYMDEICNLIAAAYEKTGEYEKSYYYLKLYNKYTEKHKAESVSQRSTSIEIQNILEETKQEKVKLQNTMDRMNHLNNLGKRITATLDLNKLIELLIETVGKYVKADTFGIGLYDEDKGILSYTYFIEDGVREYIEPKYINDKNSLAAYCLRNKAFVLINDFNKDYFKYISNNDISYGRNSSINSIIYSPLMVNDTLIGVLSVQSHDQNAFNEFSVESIETLASYASIALNNSIKSRELREEIKTRKKAETRLLIANEALNFLSKNDALTLIHNRGSFDKFLDTQWNYHLKNKKSLSLILIDVDSFKEYNDNYGHVQGDKCLKTIAKILKDSLKKDYFVARYGGDEFAVILPSTELNIAIDFCEELRQNVLTKNLSHSFSNVASRVTITLGVTNIIPNDDDKINAFISQADSALYCAKNQGRNGVSSFNSVLTK